MEEMSSSSVLPTTQPVEAWVVDAFTRFDLNHDGVLEQSEVVSMLEAVGHNTDDSYVGQAVKMFGQYDADGNGILDMVEFSALAQHLHLQELMTSLDLPQSPRAPVVIATPALAPAPAPAAATMPNADSRARGGGSRTRRRLPTPIRRRNRSSSSAGAGQEPLVKGGREAEADGGQGARALDGETAASQQQAPAVLLSPAEARRRQMA